MAELVPNPENTHDPKPVTGNWNRLEGSPRADSIARSLKSEVHDGLWFLTRQWQLGEFQGEDTGSAVMAKIEVENTQINRYAPLGKNAGPYSDDVPLEARVERQPVNIDLALSLRIGHQWLKLLDAYGAEFNSMATGNYTAYSSGVYKSLYCTAFPITQPTAPALGDSGLETTGQWFSNTKAFQVRNATAGRSMDGGTFLLGLQDSSINAETVTATVPVGEEGSVHSEHQAFVVTAAAELVTWFGALYSQPDSSEPSAWKENQLEYQFSCTVPDGDDSGNKTIISAEEYYSGSLDWWSFDIDSTGTADGSLTATNGSVNEAVTSKTEISMIPTGVQFAGMPNTRWWEFEDGQVNFTNLDAKPNETAKLLLAEFSLVHSNNWSVIPYTVPVGSLSEVKSIVVTDVFGQHTLVKAAAGGAREAWEQWGLFNMSKKAHPNSSAILENDGYADARLFVPPVITDLLESKPIESINFVRDEMANMVWAIENTIPDLLGGGQDGKRASERLAAYLQQLLGEDDTGTINENTAKLRYLLSTSVPEHWIPFIPIQDSNNTRSIVLQRAAQPRYVDGVPTTALPAIGARTGIVGNPAAPYFVFEEEVPRAGVIVQETWQRTRWYNGKTVLWKGRKKQTGRGEATSNLMFDQVKEKGAAGEPI